jgi:hypothetical protein
MMNGDKDDRVADSIRDSTFSIPNFFARLFGRRARELRRVVEVIGADAVPLTMTEFRHPEFSAVLPGVWRELQRTFDACEFQNEQGSESLTIAVHRLASPVPEKELSAAILRVVAQRHAAIGEEHGRDTTWTSPEVIRRENATEARSDGYGSEQRMHYALLERISKRRVFSALIMAQGERDGGLAFSNRATVIFDRLASK